FRFHAIVFILFLLLEPPTPEISTLSLHDALPIFAAAPGERRTRPSRRGCPDLCSFDAPLCDSVHPEQPAARSARSWPESHRGARSEEHTSELQSRSDLVCRLLLEKKNQTLTLKQQ